MPALAPTDRWPRTLWLVRHGESAGNVARDVAEAEGRPVVDVANRGMDVPLSGLGEQQARAVGEWLADLPENDRPSHALGCGRRGPIDFLAREILDVLPCVLAELGGARVADPTG